MAVAKRARVEDDDEENTMTLTVASSGEGQRKNALVRTIKRTSGLEAPIVSLAGAHGVSKEGGYKRTIRSHQLLLITH
jgi:Prp8 binding protein